MPLKVQGKSSTTPVDDVSFGIILFCLVVACRNLERRPSRETLSLIMSHFLENLISCDWSNEQSYQYHIKTQCAEKIFARDLISLNVAFSGAFDIS